MPLVDGDLTTTLWTTADAAEAASVTVNTFRNWVYRGHLRAAGLDENNRPVYRAIDVVIAEKATRQQARRRYRPVSA